MTVWAIAHTVTPPGREQTTAYWLGDRGCWSTLDTDTEIRTFIRTWPSKKDAEAAYQEEHGKLPRARNPHRAVQLTDEQVAHAASETRHPVDSTIPPTAAPKPWMTEPTADTDLANTDLFELAALANRHHTEIVRAIRSAVEHAWHAGRALQAAKNQTKHGEWLGWLEHNFHGSHDTARNYMTLASNYEHARDLDSAPSIRSALEAIQPDKPKPEPKPEPKPKREHKEVIEEEVLAAWDAWQAADENEREAMIDGSDTIDDEVIEAEIIEPEPESDAASLRPIDTLLAELAATIEELERHTGDTAEPGDASDPQSWTAPPSQYADQYDRHEIDPRKLRDHPFADDAHKVVKALTERLEEISSTLWSAEYLRAIWPTMTPTQKRHYLKEIEDHGDHVEYDALLKRHTDQQQRRELRAKVDSGQCYPNDVDYLKRLDERAAKEGWDSPSPSP
jgi:hypothetical protein